MTFLILILIIVSLLFFAAWQVFPPLGGIILPIVIVGLCIKLDVYLRRRQIQKVETKNNRADQ